MYVIDVTLKQNPLSLSVERKSVEEAEALYKQILEALRSGSDLLLELTCDRQTNKKIGILVSEISGVQMAEKSSTAAGSGRPPGFFAVTDLGNEE
ncbi:MAG: hypothetical protein AB4352_23350 [Hormoscilla sp.]